MKKALLIASVQSHIAQFHRPLIKVLKEKGYIIDVAARNNLDEKNGLKIENADHIFDVPFHRSPIKKQNRGAYARLKKIIDEGDYELISCNTPVASVLTRLAARDARKKGTRLFYMAHGFHFYNGAPLRNWILYYPIEKVSAHLADTIITITDVDYEFAKKKFSANVVYMHGAGADQNKFLSVTPEKNESFRHMMDYDQHFVILCTGELNSNKNQSTLIKAMPLVLQKHPETLLLMAGNGPKHDDLQKLIDSMNLNDQAILINYHPDIEIYTNACDLVVSVSFREGLPMNIVEGMICRKPVLVSHNRGHDQLVDDQVNGMFAKADDPQDIAEKIVYLIEHPEVREKLADAGRETAKLYQMDHIEKEIRKIYFGEE